MSNRGLCFEKVSFNNIFAFFYYLVGGLFKRYPDNEKF